MQAIGYVRVSTQEQAQEGASLAAQRQAIEEECRRRGWELAEVIEDAGYSAKDLQRPGIQRALSLLENGAETLVVAKLDRLSRSVLDFAGLMDRAQQAGWSLVVLDLGVDMTTPQGQLLVDVMAAFAAFERKLIAQRVREGMAERKRQGATFGRPRQLDKRTATRIKRMRGRGMPYRRIADKLNADNVATAHGGRQWYASTVRAVAGQSRRG